MGEKDYFMSYHEINIVIEFKVTEKRTKTRILQLVPVTFHPIKMFTSWLLMKGNETFRVHGHFGYGSGTTFRVHGHFGYMDISGTWTFRVYGHFGYSFAINSTRNVLVPEMSVYPKCPTRTVPERTFRVHGHFGYTDISGII